MCGRYLLDIDGDSELYRLWQTADSRMAGRKGMRAGGGNGGFVQTGEICPTACSVIVKQTGCHQYADGAFWGFPFQKKQIFLARIETILEKPMFSESMLYRRCIVPASGFYEWTRENVKKKYYFRPEDGETLYMAGIWQSYEDGDHFAIVTTAADACMAPVHDRMPVILDREQAQAWLSDWQLAWRTASQAAPVLRKKCCETYEQLTLF